MNCKSSWFFGTLVCLDRILYFRLKVLPLGFYRIDMNPETVISLELLLSVQFIITVVRFCLDFEYKSCISLYKDVFGLDDLVETCSYRLGSLCWCLFHPVLKQFVDSILSTIPCLFSMCGRQYLQQILLVVY